MAKAPAEFLEYVNFLANNSRALYRTIHDRHNVIQQPLHAAIPSFVRKAVLGQKIDVYRTPANSLQC